MEMRHSPFLFLLFDALYLVHAATVPHYVDLAPRNITPLAEAALIKATASTTNFAPPPGTDLEVYPTSYTPGGPIPTGGLTVVFSITTSAQLRTAYQAHCEPQGLDYSDCSNALAQIVGSQQSIQKRFAPSPAGVVLGLIAFIFIGVASFLSSSAATGNQVANTPITVSIPPSALSTIPTASATTTNQVDVTCWPQKDCSGSALWCYNTTNVAATPGQTPTCYTQTNCQCITYASTDGAIQVWNGHECTGSSSFAYAPSGCHVQANGKVETAGTNSLQFIPVC